MGSEHFLYTTFVVTFYFQVCQKYRTFDIGNTDSTVVQAPFTSRAQNIVTKQLNTQHKS